ncbi:MAG: hypothetical protein J5I93_29390 [Pirellulaceae bacterium]|nr:hypothetical protein [Pirellulaceae bacterium]
MSASGAWMVSLVLAPLLAASIALVVGRRSGPYAALAAAAAIVCSLAGLIGQLERHGAAASAVGGWGSPLGIQLHADGLSVLMLLMSALVGVGVTAYAWGYFGLARRRDEPFNAAASRARESFWPLWLFAWGGLHALFLSGDIFNLYVALELLTLSAVGLIGLANQRTASFAALRYLLASLVGSLFYLLGVALLYGEYAVLDCQRLLELVQGTRATTCALALMTLGLMLKTALFPLHFWLPLAHGNSPAPVSALLSSLVVTACFYAILRLWCTVFANAGTPGAGMLLALLGAAAIVYGSLQAICQQRLKMLIAYSTVAQVGYLFLGFAFLGRSASAVLAWQGVVYYALSHACAKGAMFLAAGSIMRSAGHDQLEGLAGIGKQLPVSVFAFGLAGMSLMGLPPSGGFVGKWLLLRAALEAGLWWVAVTILAGGLLAAGYTFPLLERALANRAEPWVARRVPRGMELASLVLALCAVALGLVAAQPLELLEIGAPFQPLASQEANP